MNERKPGELYLGTQVDPASGEATGLRAVYDARDLTTHGVIVGMTGSGKTGLGIILLEEALLSGVPVLVLDPKGDMGNLLLNFPDLQPDSFEPWVNEGDARRKDMDVAQYARKTADDWRSGLERSGIGPDRLRELKDRSRTTVYTPGSSAGVPINIVGSLSAPDLDWDDSAEVLRDEIEGFVTSLLGLAGIAGDPISSREHILLANIIEASWSAGRDLDLPGLIAQVQKPPFRKLGVFDLDKFYPEKDRTELAMRLNGLIASPSFAEWLQGPPLDVGSLLESTDGRTTASIIYMAHLSDEARQFITTLVLSKVVTWMRGQSGTTDLRLLIYMDEVFGFVPPSANPPSKKPILTILKQARAFGVGMVLSTQNPVDLDYKAMSNAGAWFCGRLQTERDKARVVEALTSARGDVDVKALDSHLSGLAKRQFLLQSAHLKEPILFNTRWAMSYLRGPLTREQISVLMAGVTKRSPSAAETAAAGDPSAMTDDNVAAPAPLADDETEVAPATASGVPVYYLDPAAPWAQELGVDPTGRRLEAGIAARVHLLFDDRRAGVDHREEWEAVFFPAPEHFDAAAVLPVDFDQRDFESAAPTGAVYVLPSAPIDSAAYFRTVKKDIKDELHRNQRVEVLRNKHLKLYSRVGESREEFVERCHRAADDKADAEAAKIRDRLEQRLDRLQRGLFESQQRVERLELDLSSRKQDELVSGAGALLGALLGGRSSTSKLSRAARSVRGASSRRGITARTEKRLDEAEAKVDAKVEDIEVLEERIVDELAEIDDKWSERAADIEELAIGLEKTDIDVDEVSIVWLAQA